MLRGLSLSLMTCAAASLAGCSRNRPTADTRPVPSQPVAVARAVDSTAAREAARRDSLAREERLREERAADLRATRTIIETPILFAYDRAELSPEAREKLEQKARALKSRPEIRVRLSGHADERGSDEYNIALGHRRAATAREFLIVMGIGESRLEAVSMGEEEPVCTTPDEPCWSRNRRVELAIVGSVVSR